MVNADDPSLRPAANKAFVERLRACVDKARSARAFAEQAGIPPSTLHSYLTGVEPQRHVLVNLAAAAGVSVGWLAAGTTEQASKESAEVNASLDLSGFRNNLRYLIRENEGAEKLAAHVSLSASRIVELAETGTPTVGELSWLSRVTGSIDEFLRGSLETKDLQMPESLRFGRLLNAGNAIARLNPGTAVTWSCVLEEMIQLTKGARVVSFSQPDESMEPFVCLHDVVVALDRPHIVQPGLYLMERLMKKFVCRVIAQPSGQLILSYDNPQFRVGTETKFDASLFQVIGPVILRVTRQKLPGE